MHAHPLLLAFLTIPLAFAAPAPAPANPSSKPSTTTILPPVSFGIDPLLIAQSGGNQNLTSVISDPSHAHTGTGYLSLSFPATTDKTYVVFYYPFSTSSSAPKNYTSSFWAKAVGGKAAQCYAFTGFADDYGNNQTEGVLLTKKYEEVRYVDEYERKGKQKLNALFTVSCTGGKGATVYVDDVAVTEGSS